MQSVFSEEFIKIMESKMQVAWSADNIRYDGGAPLRVTAPPKITAKSTRTFQL
jgi:hypothetical protein